MFYIKNQTAFQKLTQKIFTAYPHCSVNSQFNLAINLSKKAVNENINLVQMIRH